MTETGQSSQLKSTKVLHVGMWACCAVMFLPLMVFFALAHMACCSSILGKSCHGDRTTSDADAPVSAKAVGLASKDA